MESKKVAVLLSTYNGEKYIKQQMDSILSQTYDNIEIYVRDDGSQDNTLKILEQYEADGKIHLERGNNCGFIESFFGLIMNSGNASYYAFADQDDFWFPEKLAMAVEELEKTDKSKPVLYFSNYDFYDKDLNFMGHSTKKQLKPSFYNSLVDCMPLGFCTVFNHKACEMVRENPPKHSCGHDWWMYMVCAGLGQVIYDPRVTVKYRRIGNNVSAGGMSFWKFQIWRIKKFILNDYLKNVREQLKEYGQIYAQKLTPENRKKLYLFTGEHYRFFIAMKKVFYPKRFRVKIIDEILLRLLFLTGKL